MPFKLLKALKTKKAIHVPFFFSLFFWGIDQEWDESADNKGARRVDVFLLRLLRRLYLAAPRNHSGDDELWLEETQDQGCRPGSRTLCKIEVVPDLFRFWITFSFVFLLCEARRGQWWDVRMLYEVWRLLRVEMQPLGVPLKYVWVLRCCGYFVCSLLGFKGRHFLMGLKTVRSIDINASMLRV